MWFVLYFKSLSIYHYLISNTGSNHAMLKKSEMFTPKHVEHRNQDHELIKHMKSKHIEFMKW